MQYAAASSVMQGCLIP